MLKFPPELVNVERRLQVNPAPSGGDLVRSSALQELLGVTATIRGRMTIVIVLSP